MPCYRLLCWARPESSPKELAETFRNLARLVYREQGQFRTIDNLGVRPLGWTLRKPYERFNEARLVECKYDIAPDGKDELENYLKSSTPVLRYFHFKDTSKLGEFKRGAPKKGGKKHLTAEMLRTGHLFNPETNKVERDPFDITR
eukprot:gb/GECG01011323.1/.p1 GENE.gb/GECG01011323.1/~~gb/GECG01011323.1/.p1  ORF type:complete len:145 (+),score=11.76 gb/GECG01011323.1/:1-435(+)